MTLVRCGHSQEVLLAGTVRKESRGDEGREVGGSGLCQNHDFSQGVMGARGTLEQESGRV